MTMQVRYFDWGWGVHKGIVKNAFTGFFKVVFPGLYQTFASVRMVEYVIWSKLT